MEDKPSELSCIHAYPYHEHTEWPGNWLLAVLSMNRQISLTPPKCLLYNGYLWSTCLPTLKLKIGQDLFQADSSTKCNLPLSTNFSGNQDYTQSVMSFQLAQPKHCESVQLHNDRLFTQDCHIYICINIHDHSIKV